MTRRFPSRKLTPLPTHSSALAAGCPRARERERRWRAWHGPKVVGLTYLADIEPLGDPPRGWEPGVVAGVEAMTTEGV